MNNFISSAGLVYLYLNGYEEDGFLRIQAVNTYQYMEETFYQQVMEQISMTDKEEKTVHAFAVLGAKEKAEAVYRLLEDEVKKNFQRILTEKSIQITSRELDKTGNAFFKCVQKFFCEQLGHFPQRILFNCEDFLFAGIGCNCVQEDPGVFTADNIVSWWMEQEEPYLCGKQMMIRSFLLRDLVGRKVVACIPQIQMGTWRLVFEGGHQLSLDTQLSYMDGTIHPDELGGFSSSNLQTILMNPLYAYGVWFQPSGLCEEWHKVFLYLCAVSEYEWDDQSISNVYRKFLKILQNSICKTSHAKPLLSKTTYHGALLLHIQRFRAFLKGEDEPVVSKDLHQTMNSRYVYLPYLWPLVPHPKTHVDFSPSVLHNMTKKAMCVLDSYKKGALWEDTATYVLKSIPGWKITGRRIRAGAQEIDISVANVSLDDELWKLGAYILVECKNWRKHVDLPQIRNIAHISNMKGNQTAILFSAMGVTKGAREEINRLSTDGLWIICITADDLLQIQSETECRDLILNKWKTLQEESTLQL